GRRSCSIRKEGSMSGRTIYRRTRDEVETQGCPPCAPCQCSKCRSAATSGGGRSRFENVVDTTTGGSIGGAVLGFLLGGPIGALLGGAAGAAAGGATGATEDLSKYRRGS